MRFAFRIFPFILAAVLTSCGTSKDTAQDSTAEHHHSTTTPPPKPPTAVAENMSGIEAVVEDVQDLGGSQFNLRIFVISSSPVGGTVNVVENGQKLMVSPQYYADTSGHISFDEPRNKRILSLKSKTSGESFKGKVTINRKGGWNIVDVEEPK